MIFDNVLDSFIILFFIAMVFFIATIGITGMLSPLTKSMNSNTSIGYSGTSYNTQASLLDLGLVITFLIMLGIPFLYLIVKALFKTEENSQYIN
jgi:hypothetical protein